MTSWTEWLAEHRTPDAIGERVLDLACVARRTRVVDLGAGTGFLSERARDRGADVVAVEPDDGCLAELRALGLDAARGDAASIPLRDASVDAVVTRSVLIYVERLDAAAREIARVLRPGGRLAAFEPLNGDAVYLHDVVDWTSTGIDVAADDRAWLAREDPLSRLTADPLRAALEGAGFVDVHVEVERENEPWLVTRESVDARLDAVAAPGQPSRRDRWVARYGAATAARLVAHLHAHEGTTLPLRWAWAFVSARTP